MLSGPGVVRPKHLGIASVSESKPSGNRPDVSGKPTFASLCIERQMTAVSEECGLPLLEPCASEVKLSQEARRASKAGTLNTRTVPHPGLQWDIGAGKAGGGSAW